jgi:hypothetical protein
MSAIEAGKSLLARLCDAEPLVTVELRPPRTDVPASQGMDTWIDMHHTMRRLARHDTIQFLTDNAVGEAEEENLRHLVSNLGGDVSTRRIVPFLTCKHTLDYCLMYADRAVAHGFPALTVLGGDRTVGPPRCLDYAYLLRQRIRARHPDLMLGGWANPIRDPVAQVDFLLDPGFTGEFFLTQIVSHHQLGAVERFLAEAERRGVRAPGVFGVFFYRSGNPATLEKLAQFFPVPVEGVRRDFAAGLSAEEICVRTIRALRDLGVTKVYVSNLGFTKPEGRYRRLLEMLAA